ncbi:hypothetical protein BM477_06555 [Boudabousia marimammalium]|uniref:Uncharacterized protein n=1 Tax=Boudabousia marimammalium TaxID=156892 RepID=A0A1Q5PM60_9ACTO|nr:hypothetical protein BM477_06555 [Boudabousia marimammalium]
MALAILIFGDPTGRSLFDALALLLVSLTLLAHGIWRRFGVDKDKVWTKFGPWFYREVHFSGITRLEGGIQRFKLYESGTMVNVDYQRFDYSLVYVRLLEELQKRRFGLPGVGVDSPDWDMAAQQWRQTIALRLYKLQKKYYDSHPQSLEYLNSLTETPASYIN